ncbi:MAG TPA: hypothetical protein VGL89_12145 [Candidatus Koribacter sp.]|jgi:hypothetical protein
MRILTKRFENVQVITMASLRQHLEQISSKDCRFSIDKARSGRVSVRAECCHGGKKVRPAVVLPTYPTGHEHDDPVNPNVVLDPIEFHDADSTHLREVFEPLLGSAVLQYYEKMHPAAQLQMTRCC